MTDKTYRDAADALHSKQELSGSFTVDGDEYPLIVLEATLNELEAIEDDVEDGADEADVVREICDEYLVEPDVPPGDIPVRKLYALFEGMREAWTNSEAIDAAEAAMPVDSGNRRTSRR
jgi:hypothetical protein